MSSNPQETFVKSYWNNFLKVIFLSKRYMLSVFWTFISIIRFIIKLFCFDLRNFIQVWWVTLKSHLHKYWKQEQTGHQITGKFCNLPRRINSGIFLRSFGSDLKSPPSALVIKTLWDTRYGARTSNLVSGIFFLLIISKKDLTPEFLPVA